MDFLLSEEQCKTSQGFPLWTAPPLFLGAPHGEAHSGAAWSWTAWLTFSVVQSILKSVHGLVVTFEPSLKSAKDRWGGPPQILRPTQPPIWCRRGKCLKSTKEDLIHKVIWWPVLGQGKLRVLTKLQSDVNLRLFSFTFHILCLKILSFLWMTSLTWLVAKKWTGLSKDRMLWIAVGSRSTDTSHLIVSKNQHYWESFECVK